MELGNINNLKAKACHSDQTLNDDKRCIFRIADEGNQEEILHSSLSLQLIESAPSLSVMLRLIICIALGALQSSVAFRFASNLRAIRTRSKSARDHQMALTNEQDWNAYFEKNHDIRYQIIAAPTMETMAENLVGLYPKRFLYHKTQWEKFPDGTDCIEIGGFQPTNRISGENVLMLASFHNNDVTLSQFSVMITLLQSFIESLTVVLPFYPVGTMERIIQEGQVATANSYAQMFSNLPTWYASISSVLKHYSDAFFL